MFWSGKGKEGKGEARNMYVIRDEDIFGRGGKR